MPSATSTRPPAPVYLPIAINERFCDRVQRSDVAIALDASTSMNERDAYGRRKIDAAIHAAAVLLDRLAFHAGDKAAVVTFNADARLGAELTADRDTLDRALADITLATTTCLVCGVEAAVAELQGPRHGPDNSTVLILLTDGRSNPRPASDAVAAAEAARHAGVIIFTIGLGEDLDRDALRSMAGDTGEFYETPDGRQLDGIYERIAVLIPCPGVGYWPGPR
jgi:Ca-activated chloride channel family protein